MVMIFSSEEETGFAEVPEVGVFWFMSGYPLITGQLL